VSEQTESHHSIGWHVRHLKVLLAWVTRRLARV
jgi:hypothetical protein